jgi:hypothetical protein
MWTNLQRQTCHFTDTRIKEHHQHIHLEQPDRSAMAEHIINSEYQTQDISILSTKSRHRDNIIMEAIETEFHPATLTGRMASI